MIAAPSYSREIFTAAMKWVYAESKDPLDQYDMVKVHVLADFNHLLRYGEPLIGGQPAAWPYGPVVKDSFFRAKEWAANGGDFRLVNMRGKACQMAPSAAVTAGEVSILDKAAQESLWKAWELHSPMSFPQSYDYFHTQVSHFGRVWLDANARGRGTLISWEDVVQAYESMTGEDLSYVKRLIRPMGAAQYVEAGATPEQAEAWADLLG